MNVLLLLVLVSMSTGEYDTKIAPMPSMEYCEGVIKEVLPRVPKAPGLSYSLSCVTVRATTEMEVMR